MATIRSKYSILLLLIVSLQLLCLVKTDSGVIPVTNYYIAKEETLKVKKHFTLELTKDQIEKVHTKANTIFVTLEGLEGNAVWSISGRAVGSKEADETYHKIEGPLVNKKPQIVAINSESDLWPEINKDGKIYLAITNTGPENEEVKLMLMVAQASEFLDAPVGAHYFVHVSNLKELKMRTKITAAKGNHHYKFMLEEHKHRGVPTMSAIVSKSVSGNDVQFSPSEFIRFDQSRIGYVIDKSNPNMYCAEGVCDYEITATLENVKLLEVYFGEHIDYELLSDQQSTVS